MKVGLLIVAILYLILAAGVVKKDSATWVYAGLAATYFAIAAGYFDD